MIIVNNVKKNFKLISFTSSFAMNEPIYVDMIGIFYFVNSVVRHPDQLNQNSVG